MLWDTSTPRGHGPGKINADSLARAAGRLGMKIQYLDVARREDLKGLLERVAASPMDALVMWDSPLLRGNRGEFASIAIRRKIPAISDSPRGTESGALFTLAPDDDTVYERTASYVDRILKGAKPADLPVEEPTLINLIVNLKIAKAIGITIPQSILLRADKVIE